MAGVLEPITFSRKIEGNLRDLTVPKEFIRDIELGDGHLMIMLRVTGPDTGMVTDFFEDSEGKTFTIKTTTNQGNKISEKYIMTSIYTDEGPPLSVDIDIEPPMVRAILDFESK